MVVIASDRRQSAHIESLRGRPPLIATGETVKYSVRPPSRPSSARKHRPPRPASAGSRPLPRSSSQESLLVSHANAAADARSPPAFPLAGDSRGPVAAENTFAPAGRVQPHPPVQPNVDSRGPAVADNSYGQVVFARSVRGGSPTREESPNRIAWTGPIAVEDNQLSRLLEPLVYLLEPLLKDASGSKRDASQDFMTLAILLCVTSLAHACTQGHMSEGVDGLKQVSKPRSRPGSRPTSARRGETCPRPESEGQGLGSQSARPRSRPHSARPGEGGARPEPDIPGIAAHNMQQQRTLQHKTLARRAKTLIAELRTCPRKEHVAPLFELCQLIQKHNHMALDLLEDECLALLVEQADTGGLDSKKYAAILLRHMAIDEGTRTAVAAKGGIRPLVKLVGSNAKQPRLEAMLALASLACGHKRIQDEVVKSGIFSPLIKMLQPDRVTSYSEDEQLAAASAVCVLIAGNDDNCQTLVSEGGVAPLIRFIMPRVCTVTQLQVPVGKTSQAVVAFTALQGIIERCVKKASRPAKNPVALDLWQPAAEALRRLTVGSPLIGVGSLLHLLLNFVNNAKPTHRALGHAVATLLVLAFESEPGPFIEADAVPFFVRCFSDDKDFVKRAASLVLQEFYRSDLDGRKVILDNIPKIVEFLQTDDAHEQTTAVLSLVAQQPEGQVAICNANAVVPLVMLASTSAPSITEATATMATSILCNLSKQSLYLPSLISLGVSVPCVAWLGSENMDKCEAAAAAIQRISGAQQTVSRANSALVVDASGNSLVWAGGQEAVVAANGVAPLIHLLGHGSARAQAEATRAMHNLVRHAETCQAVARELGSVSALLVVVQHTDEVEVKEHAAAALACLSEAGRQDDIMREGGIAVLISLSKDCRPCLFQAMRVMCSLADKTSSHARLAAGGLDRIVEVAGDLDSEAHDFAVALLNKLAVSKDADAQSAVGKNTRAAMLLVQFISGNRVQVGPHRGGRERLAGDWSSQRQAPMEISRAVGASQPGNNDEPHFTELPIAPSSTRHGAVLTEDGPRKNKGHAAPNLIAGEPCQEDDELEYNERLMCIPNENSKGTLQQRVGGHYLQNGSGGLAEQWDGGHITQAHSDVAIGVQSSSRHVSEAQNGLARSPQQDSTGVAPHATGRSSDPVAVQAPAVSSLRQLCRHAEAHTAIVQSGGVDALVSANHSRELDAHSRREAAFALAQLAVGEHSEVVASSGGCEVLINEMRESKDGDLSQAVAKALRKLVAYEPGHSTILSHGVATCVELLQDPREEVQMNALFVLDRLAEQCDGQAAICKAKPATPLVTLANGSDSLTEAATNILCHLSNQANELVPFITAGAATPIVKWLTSYSPLQREAAAAAVMRISGTISEASDGSTSWAGGQEAVMRAGGLAPLLRLLSDESALTQAASMHALYNLVRCQTTRAMVAADPDSVSRCVDILTNVTDDVVRESAAATLSCLSDAGRREDIIDAHGVGKLVVMVEANERGILQAASALCSLADLTSAHAHLASESLTQMLQLASQRGDEASSAASSMLHKLAIGGVAEAQSALAALPDALGLFVQHLREGGLDVQAAAAKSLRELSEWSEARQAIADVGGVPVLVSAADSNELDISSRKASAFTIANLAGPPHTDVVSCAGGAEVLIKFLTADDGSKLNQEAMSALTKLVMCEASRIGILTFGVPACVDLLPSTDSQLQCDSLFVLQQLALQSDGQVAIAKAEAIGQFVQLADAEMCCTMATSILANLAKQDDQLISLINAGATKPLVAWLSSDKLEEREAAAAALRAFTAADENTHATTTGSSRGNAGQKCGQVAVKDAAGILPLVRVLQVDTGNLQADAMYALHNLARFPGTIQATLAETDVIPASVHVLQSTDVAEIKEQAAAALACFSEAGRCEHIADADGINELAKLLDGWSPQCQLQAIRAMCSLADVTATHQSLVEAGLSQIVTLASCSNSEPRNFASALFHKLALGGITDAQTSIAGFPPALAWLVQQLTSELAEQHHAAISLHQLCSLPAARETIVECGGVAAVVAVAAVLELDEVARKAAASVLAELARPPYTEVVASSGSAEVLIEFMDADGGGKLAQTAIAALTHLVKCEIARSAILACGVTPCVELLRGTETQLHCDSLFVLHHLALQSDGQIAIGSANAIDALVKLSVELQTCTLSTGILAHLSKQPDLLASLINSGAAKPLVAWLSSSSLEARELAAAAIQRMSGMHGKASNDGVNEEMGGPGAIIACGGAAPLVNILLSDTGTVQANAIHAIYNLTLCAETLQVVACEKHLPQACVQLLQQSTDDVVTNHTAAVLASLSETGSGGGVLAAGGIEGLTSLVQNGGPGWESGLKAICSLADDVSCHSALVDLNLSQILETAGKGSAESEDVAASTSMNMSHLSPLLHKLATGGVPEAEFALAGSKKALDLFMHEIATDPDKQVIAVQCVRQMCKYQETFQTIIDNGVAPLVAMVEAHADVEARWEAALVLSELAVWPHGDTLAAAGATETLITAMTESNVPLVTSSVANALEHLVTCEEGRKVILEKGVVPCVSLLHSQDADLQSHALFVLNQISAQDDGQSAANEANAIPPLIPLLRQADLEFDAMQLLDRLVCDKTTCEVLKAEAGINALCFILKDGEAKSQELAIGTLSTFCIQMQSLEALGDNFNNAAISAVSQFCRHGEDLQTCEEAGEVLSLLATDKGNAKTILSSGGAQGLAQLLLDSSISERSNQQATTALDLLADVLCQHYAERLLHAESDGTPQSIMQLPPFWCNGLIEFLTPETQETYPNILAVPGDFYFELYHLCSVVKLRQLVKNNEVDGEGVAKAVLDVLETFENEANALRFISGVFPIIVARYRARIDDFDDFNISDLPNLANLGNEVSNRVKGLALAEKALADLYMRHLREERPSKWKHLFKEAAGMAYNLKYMFRESLSKAREKFLTHLDVKLEGAPKEIYTSLVHGALEMYKGLVDQATLAATDFLTNPQALVKVVRDGVKNEDERVQLIGEIAAKYMESYINQDPPKLPLTPHHTQVMAMLIFSQFFERREEIAAKGMRVAILQMQTGEGKSIVIAMMAIYSVVRLKRRVHVLENNEGLLERDYATYRSFYKSFGLSCSKSIDSTSDICYCLKKQNNAYFNDRMLQGDLDLSSTILIVDEVDDLVVNEKPTLLYQTRDVMLTPQYKACYEALIAGEDRPEGMSGQIWDTCARIQKVSDSKKRGVHYERSGDGWAMLEEGPDGTPRWPKVALSDDWLVFKNFKDFQIDPSKSTFRTCLCTPFMYLKYACIFGLTGSIGGEAERSYIAKTYSAVPYDVPQFLKTCDNTTKVPATNLGVVIKQTTTAMIRESVEVAKKYHTKTPVLIITRGGENDELQKVVKVLVEVLSEGQGAAPVAEQHWNKLKTMCRLGQAASSVESSPAPQASTTPSTTSRPAAGGGHAAAFRLKKAMSRSLTIDGSEDEADVGRSASMQSAAEAGRSASLQSVNESKSLPNTDSFSGTWPAPNSRKQKKKSIFAAVAKATMSFSKGLSGLLPSSPQEKPNAALEKIQLLQERNEAGESMIEKCNSIVEHATKRCYTRDRQSYFPVTVTDWFGGRGHDFDVMDQGANENGGMLVIATSIPDAREWAQWKGRTARQDRPGQFLVVLSAEEEPFASEKGLAEKLASLPADDAIEELLKRKDASIAEALVSFEAQQARGAWLNELCEKYYRAHPRDSEAAWPSDAHLQTDVRLRDMLSVPWPSGKKILEAAADKVNVTLEGPTSNWGWTSEDLFNLEPKRQEMAMVFLIDRTFEDILQTVVDAVLNVFDKYIEHDDLVGMYGLGTGWIFETRAKGEGEEAAQTRKEIANSGEKIGEPEVYSSILKCLQHLGSEKYNPYSKWLVVITDTADFECANEKGAFDNFAPQRAAEAVDKVQEQMASMSGTNLVIIDASGIAKFDEKHKMWPTWHKLAQRLCDEVGEGNTGLNILATEVSAIDAAFESIAGAMSGGAAG